MRSQDRDLHVNRIIAGCVKCKVPNKVGDLVTLLLKTPTSYFKYMGEEVYQTTLEEGRQAGLLSEDEVVQMAIDQGMWSVEKQAKLDSLPKDIEELKVRMYECNFKSRDKEVAKKVCVAAKADVKKLQEERAAFLHLSAEGAANLAKGRYILAFSLYHLDGRPFFSEDTYWESYGCIVDAALEIVNRYRLTETEYREIVRLDPWRTIWSARKTDGLFNRPAVELTEEQKTLVVWSNIYDSIYQHPDCPPDSIIEDDDVLDGWMIIQKRKRTKDVQSKADQIVGNEKIRGMGEVFIPAQTPEDARKVNELNDESAKITKRQRMSALYKRGKIQEAEMPDSQISINQEITQRFKERGTSG